MDSGLAGFSSDEERGDGIEESDEYEGTDEEGSCNTATSAIGQRLQAAI